MSGRWWGFIAAFVVAIAGSLAGYPRETAVVVALLLMMSIYGLTLGGVRRRGGVKLMLGDAVGDALIGGVAMAAVVRPAIEAESVFGPTLVVATAGGVGWALPLSRAFVRAVLGPLALASATLELIAGGGCSEPLPQSIRGVLVGGVATALVVLGLVAVVIRRGLFLDGVPPLSSLRPARWTLLSFGVVELAIFTLSPGGIDLSESWSVAPFVLLLILGGTVVALSAFSPDVAERAIGLGIVLAEIWLALIQTGFEGDAAACGNPARSLAVVAVFAGAAGIAAALASPSARTPGRSKQ